MAVGSEGLILAYDARSSFTLDGAGSSPEELAKFVLDGASLTVAVRYDPASGLIGWMDAVSSRRQPAVFMKLRPFKGPAYTPPERIEIRINPKDVGPGAFLRIPGVTRKLKLESGRAKLPVLPGWNWTDVPIYVVDDKVVKRGLTVSMASSSPSITGAGPEVAPSALGRIPCWVQYEGPSHLLEPTATQITDLAGGEIQDITFRNGRISFWLVSDGLPTSHELQVRLVDKLGRESIKVWTLRVRP